MSKSIIYTIPFSSYCDLLSSIEAKFNTYKSKLLEHDLVLHHPSIAGMGKLHNHYAFIDKEYPKEAKTFGSSSNFFNCLILVNYHIGSLLQLSDIRLMKVDSIKDISISIEDLLILESFSTL